MTPPPKVTFPRPGSEFKYWASTHGDNVRGALKEHGCFMAECEVLDGARKELFKTPNKIFNDLVTTRRGNYKINGQSEIIDILEATANKSPEMSNAIEGYIKTAKQLEEKVRNIVFGPDKSPKTGYRFQMMKYKKEARLAFPDLEDREKFLAVLALNKANKITAKINGRPSSIEIRPSTFLIMDGKSLKDWKEVKIHQDGNEEKYSVGLFSYCDKGKTEAPKKQAGSSSHA